VTLYECVALQKPFDVTPREKLYRQVLTQGPRPPHRLQPNIPSDLEAITLRAMEKEPDARYQTAAEMADDLRRFVRAEPTRARPVTAWGRAVRAVKRRKTSTALAAAGVLATLTVALLSYRLVRETSELKAQVAATSTTDEVSALPEGTLPEQVDALVERWDVNEEGLANAQRAYGRSSSEARPFAERQLSLRRQAVQLAERLRTELAHATRDYESFLLQGRAADSSDMREALRQVRSCETMLELLCDCLPEANRWRRDRGRLPRELRRAFTIPKEDTDQYGNPVHRREGSYCDRESLLPFEIWLWEPRIELVLVPAGEFRMGCEVSAEETARLHGGDPDAYTDELPQHRVRLTKPCYMGKYELTQGQWRAVMPTAPWEGREQVIDDPRCPAVYILPEHCGEFLAALNALAGPGFRLPTEAEWEYACRAGTTSAYFFGDDGRKLGHYAWIRGNTCMVNGEFVMTHSRPVGKKIPNPWGLYDVYGNAYEWCQDVSSAYPTAPQVDPCQSGTGPRVFRGGGFKCLQSNCRSAVRFFHGKAGGHSSWSLRLVREWQRAE